MARRKKEETKVVSEEVQEKALEYLVLTACIKRLVEKQKGVKHELEEHLKEEGAKECDIIFDGEKVGTAKPRRVREFGLKDRNRLAEVLSVRQMLELLNMNASTYDALKKVYAEDEEKLEALDEAVSVTTRESLTVSKARKVEEEKYAKAAIEKSLKEAEDAVNALVAILHEGKDDPAVSEMLEELDEDE